MQVFLIPRMLGCVKAALKGTLFLFFWEVYICVKGTALFLNDNCLHREKLVGLFIM